MPDPSARIRLALANGQAGAAWHALELAHAAAKEAGERAIAAHQRLPPDQQLALALQAADEALEALALGLAADAEAAGQEG